jgi:hypothetical protein
MDQTTGPGPIDGDHHRGNRRLTGALSPAADIPLESEVYRTRVQAPRK